MLAYVFLFLAVCIHRSEQSACGNTLPVCDPNSCKTANPTTLSCVTGCNGVTSPKLTINSFTATQNGNPINTNGGISLGSSPLHVTIVGTKSVQSVATPLIDLSLASCNKGFLQSKCQWNHIPDPIGALSGLDPCDSSSGILFDDCHLSKYPLGQQASISVTLDLSKNFALRNLVKLLKTNTDYQIQMTLRDGNTKIMCVTAIDLLLPN